MTEKADKTRQRILESAKKEFLENSFSGASLRVIAKNAGVTTGALYGSFADKDALFNALVEKEAAYFTQAYIESHSGFASLEPENQIARVHEHTDSAIEKMLDYMFDNIGAFRLLITASAGSKYEMWLEEIIRIEEDSTYDFITVLKSNGKNVEDLSAEIIHMLAGSFIHGVMETIAHDMSREQALKNIRMLQKYANAGWDALLGL